MCVCTGFWQILHFSLIKHLGLHILRTNVERIEIQITIKLYIIYSATHYVENCNGCTFRNDIVCIGGTHYDLRKKSIIKDWHLNGNYDLTTIPDFRYQIVLSAMNNVLQHKVRHGLSLFLAWIHNHMLSNVWGEINYPFPNFNGYAVEVWERMIDFILHFTRYVICPWWY